MSLFKIHLIDEHSVTVRVDFETCQLSIAAYTLPCEPRDEGHEHAPAYAWGDMNGAQVGDDNTDPDGAGFYLRVQLTMDPDDLTPTGEEDFLDVSFGVRYDHECIQLTQNDFEPNMEACVLSKFPCPNTKEEERRAMEKLVRVVAENVDTQAEWAGINTGVRFYGAAVAAAADE